jgi:cytochrome c2
VFLLLASSLLLAAACGDDTPPVGDAARGRKLALFKCTFCHYVENTGGMIAQPLLTCIARADSEVREYEKRAADLKAMHPKAYAAEQAAIESVLAQQIHERRFELWLGEYLRDTKFDNPMTKMGNVLLSPQEKADVIAWIMTKRPAE